jgi:hypothetical protein
MPIVESDIPEIREPVHVVSRQDNKVILAGVLAGLLGSIAMAVILAVGGALNGEGPLHFIRLIATTAYGPEVAHEEVTTGVVVTGLMIHLLLGVSFGLVFGLLADAIRPRTLLGLVGAGVCYGLAIFLGMFLYVVPMLAPLMGEQQWLLAAIAHVAYGATLALYWPLTERMHRWDEDLRPIPLPVV